MWLYNFGLTCYVWIIRLVAPRHPKARLWINGRKDLYKRMAETIDPAARSINDYDELRAWFVPLRDNEEFLQKTSRIAKDYTTRHQGATGIIVRTIFN